MKWPFGKSSKSETQVITPPTPQPARPLIVTPPRAGGNGPVSLKKTQVIQVAEPPPLAHHAKTIALPLQCFRDQLPAGLLTADAPAEITVQVPTDLILPQLAQGKVALSLRDLVPLLPAQYVASRPGSGAAEQTIPLPMADVVSAIPSDAFQLANGAPADLSAPEYEDLPKLFDDSFLEEIEQSLAAEKAGPAEPDAEVPPPAPATQVNTPATPAAPTETPEQVFVKLRNLIAVMPEALFTGPRAELWKQSDPDSQVAIETAAILPQLTTGRVRIPIRLLAPKMPTGLLTVAAATSDDHVIIPMDEIVRQLPASAFAVTARPAPATEQLIADLPAEPFAEKPAATAPVVEPVMAPATASAPPPAPAPVVEPKVEPVAVPVAADADDASEPFAEEAAEAAPSPTAGSHAPLFDTEKFLADLNKHTFEDLIKLEGISRPLAKRIVEQRTLLTKFSKLEEVRQIPGITRKTFEALAGASPETLNKLLNAPHDQELSLPDVVRLTTTLPGVAGCLLTAADGLLLAASLPQGLDESRLSAFAPPLFKKIGDYTAELGVGTVQRFTLFTDRQPVSIFQAGAIYLVVVHDAQHFSKALLRRLTRISEELARLCRHRAVV